MSFLTPILTGNASLIARIIMITLVIFTIFLTHQLDANFNYHKGYDKAVVEHPQTVIQKGANAIINQGSKMGCFPVHLGSIGIGICHQ